MTRQAPSRKVCPRCGEKQFGKVKDVCHACKNETGRVWKDGGRKPAPKTGDWATAHERNH